MTSQSSIWSPASIPPVNDILNSNSCMQRGGYPMSNTQTASYPHQNYGPSSYYSDMGYLNHMQLPVMSNQMNQMNGNQVSYGSMPAPQIPRANHADCLEYKDTSSWPKFQVLWLYSFIYVDSTIILYDRLSDSLSQLFCANCYKKARLLGYPSSVVAMDTRVPRVRGASGRLRAKSPRFAKWIFRKYVYKLSQKHSSMIFKCWSVNITHLIYELTHTSRWHTEHSHFVCQRLHYCTSHLKPGKKYIRNGAMSYLFII